MAKLLRFYCGLKNTAGQTVDPDAYRRVMDTWYDGYTMYMAMGRWQGDNEQTVIFEVLEMTPKVSGNFRLLCESLARAGRQAAIMFTAFDADCVFVGIGENVFPTDEARRDTEWLKDHGLI